jgi:hypothetical protein
MVYVSLPIITSTQSAGPAVDRDDTTFDDLAKGGPSFMPLVPRRLKTPHHSWRLACRPEYPGYPRDRNLGHQPSHRIEGYVFDD